MIERTERRKRERERGRREDSCEEEVWRRKRIQEEDKIPKVRREEIQDVFSNSNRRRLKEGRKKRREERERKERYVEKECMTIVGLAQERERKRDKQS